jgi:hypothetical protein
MLVTRENETKKQEENKRKRGVVVLSCVDVGFFVVGCLRCED